MNDIEATIAYWRSNCVRADEVLVSMGRIEDFPSWLKVGTEMERWRRLWDSTEREMRGN